MGVSTNLPNQHQSSNYKGYFTWPGIAPNHATSMYLQRLNLQLSERGLLELIERSYNEGVDVRQTPFWFQDEQSGLCLGVGGFGECGDAYLWRIRMQSDKKRVSQQGSKKKRRQHNQHGRSAKEEKKEESTICVWPFFCERDSQFAQTDNEHLIDRMDEGGFALELVDPDDYAFGASLSKQRQHQRRRRRARFLWLAEVTGSHSEPECLLSHPSESSLQLGPCSSSEARAWHINKDGVLIRGLTKGERRTKKRRWIGSPIKSRALLHSNAEEQIKCVYKNGTSAVLFPCGGNTRESDNNESALVGFSLVRFPSRQLGHPSNGEDWTPWVTMEGASAKQSKSEPTEISITIESLDNSSDRHMPSSRTNSQNHASSTKQRHVEVKPTSSMLHTGLDQGSSSTRRAPLARTSASHIRDAPATSSIQGIHLQQQGVDGSADKTQQSSLLHRGKPRKHPMKPGEKEVDDTAEMAHHRPIKMPVHPYIKASKDEIWVDPMTSLEYPTDLCRYLGQTKKDAGRHTLMGVGQYYRTAFNIKVYGAALYVAKRDVLADPKFIRYATLTAEELQKRDDFYEHLMNMPSRGEDPTNSPGGFFDRTLMVKTNMQLSTDAMRKSLEADWSLLTDEMKSLIIESSFRERLADERMLEKIKSKENSSNCSCGQTAPEEYGAEPSCCARGTEVSCCEDFS